MNAKYILALIFLLSISTLAFAEDEEKDNLKFSFLIGASVPNGSLNNVFNSEQIKLNSDSLANMGYRALSSGYHIGFDLRYGINKYLNFIGSLSLNRFPEAQIEIFNPTNETQLIGRLNIIQNIIPITAGLQLYLLKTDLLSIYTLGDISFNNITFSTDISYSDKYTIPVQASETSTRMGYGYGLGISLNLQLIEVGLRAKYNMVNLMGRVGDEKDKGFTQISAVISF